MYKRQLKLSASSSALLHLSRNFSPPPQDLLLPASLFIQVLLLAPQIRHLLTLCAFINFIYLLTYLIAEIITLVVDNKTEMSARWVGSNMLKVPHIYTDQTIITKRTFPDSNAKICKLVPLCKFILSSRELLILFCCFGTQQRADRMLGCVGWVHSTHLGRRR